MKRGIARLAEIGGASEALARFEEALAIRRGLPLADSWSGYVLAASWMNRGEALVRLGGAENLTEAVRSYDEALLVLGNIDVQENPLYLRRLGIAWLNRGQTLLEAADFEEARGSLEKGLAVLDGLAEEAEIKACGWLNLANVHLRWSPPKPEAAWWAAGKAGRLLAVVERECFSAGDCGMKARHVLCQAAGEALDASSDERQGLLDEILDAVRSGMALAEYWASHGQPALEGPVVGLFRFGCMALAEYSPEQLVRFIEQQVSTDPIADGWKKQLHEVAGEVLGRVWGTFDREGFAEVKSPGFQRWTETLRALRECKSRLEAYEAVRDS